MEDDLKSMKQFIEGATPYVDKICDLFTRGNLTGPKGELYLMFMLALCIADRVLEREIPLEKVLNQNIEILELLAKFVYERGK